MLETILWVAGILVAAYLWTSFLCGVAANDLRHEYGWPRLTLRGWLTMGNWGRG